MLLREKEGQITPAEYLKWYSQHEPECPENHEGLAPVFLSLLTHLNPSRNQKSYRFFDVFRGHRK